MARAIVPVAIRSRRRSSKQAERNKGWQHLDGHRFNVFGRIFLIQREAGLWQAYALGADGKRSPAGFVVPDFLEGPELEQYLFDLFHESATPGNGDVRRLP